MAASSVVPDRVAAAFDALVGGGLTRQQLDRGGRMLRWLEAGEGLPSVVFEAGAMSTVAGFAAVFKGLVPDHRVIAYDRAGYGASDAAPLHLELQLSDLVAVLEEAGPSIIVGHSWGGLLAQLVTWVRPELVTGLVLLDPAHETFWFDLAPEVRAELGRHPDRSRPARDDPRCAEILEFGRELADDVARSVGGAQSSNDACLSDLESDEQLFTYLDELPMILDHLEDLAARRTGAVWPAIPVVLLTATKGRPAEFTPRVLEVQEQLAAQCNARHQVVPDSGHYIHVERPDLVIACVKEVAH